MKVVCAVAYSAYAPLDVLRTVKTFERFHTYAANRSRSRCSPQFRNGSFEKENSMGHFGISLRHFGHFETPSIYKGTILTSRSLVRTADTFMTVNPIVNAL